MVTAGGQESSPPTIFVVDDDRGLSRLVEKALQRESFLTASAGSFQEAVQWLQKHQPSLMLLDLKLEDGGGKELIDYLSSHGRPVPFIVITGQGDERVAVAMMKRGAIDYQVKDADFLEFVPEVVRRALGQLSRDRKLAAAEEALRRSEANLAQAQQIAHLGSFELNVSSSSQDYCSDEIYRILGLDPRQRDPSTELALRQLVHPEDRERHEEVLGQAIREALPFNFEYRVMRPDGAIRHVQSVGEPIVDPAGRVVKLVGTLLDITERKRLEQEILRISELEQRRIGQDLHDGLCQHLAATELMCQILEQNLAKRSKAAAGRVAEIGRQVREAISQTRLLARGLSPVVVESEGLMSALQELAANTERMFRVQCEFRCEIPVLVNDHSTATHLYRIAQEAISNAIRHGKARRMVVSLQGLADRIVLTVKDNGSGLPKDPAAAKGMGLRIMQYRAGMIGGSLGIQSDATKGGTLVTCSIQNGRLPHHAEQTKEKEATSPHRG
jgi:PAS domain S-box-containing protein